MTARFAAMPHVRVIRGFLPESLAQGAPERIALQSRKGRLDPAIEPPIEIRGERAGPIGAGARA